MPETPSYRRKRVFRACDPCRAMKSKCDGARPACGRCIGYGYQCAYAVPGKKRTKNEYSQSSPPHDVQSCCRQVEALRLIVDDYDHLLADEIASSLAEPGQAALLEKLHRLRERVNNCQTVELQGCNTGSQAETARTTPPTPPHKDLPTHTPLPVSSAHTPAVRQVASTERYLGEVSDVRFFNLVDRALQEENTESPRDPGSEAIDSYEQDGPSPQEAAAAAAARNNTVDNPEQMLPKPEAAERYLSIYFSTIHIAYPFIPQAPFMQAYRRFLAAGRVVEPDLDTCWLATLYILFAIGAHYDSISGDTGDTSHEQYFQRALILYDTEIPERSVVSRVSFLLAQCFYLLAACRTDKCWTTLGLAVRVAQSIGLHVDVEESFSRPVEERTDNQSLLCKIETRRRVWYSVYVLDRLLALQLGRPPAIHDDDCHLRLPSRLGDADISWDGASDADGRPSLSPAAAQIAESSVPTMGDYFICMISLSRIIGHVLRDLYNPRRASKGRSISGWLSSTQALDSQLVEWRQLLPRALRFDLGHTFETNLAFRRQRNMLAIKFHHLRTLIYRPYLCLPLLRRLDNKEEDTSGPNNAIEGSLQRPGAKAHIVDIYERICVTEAQETAHLLHNVADKESLVHDFPWWQMISCLICASSVLVVASVFTRRRGGLDTTETACGCGNSSTSTDVATLEDDAETCLKVFEALSLNSEGACIARDMMRKLKARGQRWRQSHHHQQQQEITCDKLAVNSPYLQHQTAMQGMDVPEVGDMQGLGSPDDASPSLPPLCIGDMSFMNQFPVNQEADLYSAQEWPSEILDSMAWSAQFFGAVDGSAPQFQ